VSDEALLTEDDARGKSRKRPHGAHVRLLGRHFNIKLKMGDGPAKIGNETSGWTTVDRPKDVAMTVWTSSQPLKISVPILLDGWHRQESINAKLTRLHDIVRDPKGDRRPPTFIALGPIPFSGHRFVLEQIEYGDEVLRGEVGTKHAQKLLRQDFTLYLMQYVPGDHIKFKHRKKRHHHHHRHKPKAGDTSLRVANELYGDDEDESVEDIAREIAQLNGVRGIRTKLNPDRVLRLP
jgi:hypothetical protein